MAIELWNVLVGFESPTVSHKYILFESHVPCHGEYVYLLDLLGVRFSPQYRGMK